MDDTPPPPNVDPSALSEVAKGVFLIGDRRVPLVPNIGIVLGDDSALVIDTGMGPANGAKVLEDAKDLAGPRPLILTLTHFHPEHGFGAQVFKGAAKIIYNEAQRDELRRKGEAFLGMFRTFGPTVAAALEGTKIVSRMGCHSGRRHDQSRRPQRRTPRNRKAYARRSDRIFPIADGLHGTWWRNGCSPSSRGFRRLKLTLTRRVGAS